MVDSSLVVGIGFGALNMAQWIQQRLGLHRHDARRQQLEAVRMGLEQLVAMCNDAEGKGDKDKPDAMARFISDTAHASRIVGHQVDVMLGNVRVSPAKPLSVWQRIMGWLFPITLAK